MIGEPPEEMLPVDTIAERWGPAVDAGFLAVPNILVRSQDKLGLTPNDLVVVLNIILHWWHRDRRPAPRSTAIAKRTGLGPRTVQRSLNKLEKKGLISRVRIARDRTEYNLEGLIGQLASEARSDVWYRPDLLRAGAANGKRAGAGHQNPTP